MATLRTFLEWPLRVPLTVAVTVAVLVLGQGEGLFAASASPETNPTWWLNYVYSTQPDGRERVEGAVLGDDESAGTTSAAAPKRRRRLIMHRYGGLGNQRYPIGFTGDVAALWESLAFQPAFTAAAANVNFGYWSHDIGGFYEPCEGELFVRWVQFGAFSPIVRIHGFRSAAIEKRPWHYPPRYLKPIRRALQQRLELLPHLYTAARHAHDGGPSPIRPLYHEWPHEEAAYSHTNQYVFGAGMLVAPVTNRTLPSWPLARVRFWVPPGGLWAQLHSGALLRGPTALEQAFAIDEVPVLIQAGALIFGTATPSVEWAHCAQLVGGAGWLGRAQQLPLCPQVALWLGDASWRRERRVDAAAVAAGGSAGAAGVGGSAAMYEDDGWSEAYTGDHGSQTTKVSWQLVHVAGQGGRATVTERLRLVIHPAEGCLFAAPAEQAVAPEPGQPPLQPVFTPGPQPGPAADASPYARRSWRLVLHGLAPPRRVLVSTPGELGVLDELGEPDEHVARFASLADFERQRRRGARQRPIWTLDAEQLSLVLWIFDVHGRHGATLELELDTVAQAALPDAMGSDAFAGGPTLLDTALGTTPELPATALLAMRRAQAAKALCDATYPDTVPDDYDQLIWIAGLGSRLAARPANWTAEMQALGPTLSRARRQLEAMVGRVRGDPDRLEMVHNATALLQETAPRGALP